MKRLFILLAVSVISLPAMSQNLRTGYLLENYIFNYRLNPAAQNPDTLGFVGIGIDNVSISARSTTGLSDILYPRDGKLVLGLNKAVSAEEFLSSLEEDNPVGADLNENLFALGFWSKNKRSFHTIEVNLRSNNYANYPKELMEFLKVGGNGEEYSFEDVEFNSKTYLELSYGLSRRIGESVRVGARLKLIAGAASIDGRIRKGDVRIGEDNAVADIDGYVNIAQNIRNVSINSEGGIDVGDAAVHGNPICGYGAAVDLGAEWDAPIEGLTVSASISDIGAVSWKNSTAGKFGSNIVIDYKKESDKKLDELVRLKETAPTAKLESMPANFMLAAKYRMPFYSGLEVGMVATSHRSGKASWNELRFGLGFNPVKIFSLGGSFALGTFGPSLGAAMSFRVKGFSLFVGADGFITEFSPQYIPVRRFDSSVTAGLAISF